MKSSLLSHKGGDSNHSVHSLADEVASLAEQLTAQSRYRPSNGTRPTVYASTHLHIYASSEVNWNGLGGRLSRINDSNTACVGTDGQFCALGVN
eukprot:1189536-Prorocentrum_minimum.AAC.2